MISIKDSIENLENIIKLDQKRIIKNSNLINRKKKILETYPDIATNNSVYRSFMYSNLLVSKYSSIDWFYKSSYVASANVETISFNFYKNVIFTVDNKDFTMKIFHFAKPIEIYQVDKKYTTFPLRKEIRTVKFIDYKSVLKDYPIPKKVLNKLQKKCISAVSQDKYLTNEDSFPPGTEDLKNLIIFI